MIVKWLLIASVFLFALTIERGQAKKTPKLKKCLQEADNECGQFDDDFDCCETIGHIECAYEKAEEDCSPVEPSVVDYMNKRKMEACDNDMTKTDKSCSGNTWLVVSFIIIFVCAAAGGLAYWYKVTHAE
ncbi:hypothetical protein HDE_02062 [Halotydeus destructor]|nr:hypothetical protein HDE_02062 [Halotydeus destructor]